MSNDIKKISIGIPLWCVSLFIVFVYAIFFLYGYIPPLLFAASIIIIYLNFPPRYLIHPLNVLTGYYFLFYCISLMLGETWIQTFTYTSFAERITSCMNCATFLLGYNILYYTTTKNNVVQNGRPNILLNRGNTKTLLHIAIAFCLLVLVIACSNYPLEVWLTSPGTAYQDRSGTGILLIIVICASGYMLTYGGYRIYFARNRLERIHFFLCYLFIAFLFYIPLMSRPRMIYYAVFLFLPYLFYLKLSIKVIICSVSIFISSIFTSSIIRGAFGNSDSPDFFNFLWHYCDIYYWTVTVVENEPVNLFQTSFIGLKKYLYGTGFSTESMYTISQIFTEKYVRSEIGDKIGLRTTIQFPVEVDMYINAYYILAIPILSIFFYIVGKIYRTAFDSRNLGWLYVAAFCMMIIFPSILRGMLLEYTIVYNTLICFIGFKMLKKYYL